MDWKAYQKLRLNEFNAYDIERTLRENIYTLEQENIRVEDLVLNMVNEKIPVPLILSWMRQLEDNASEIVYVTSLVEHDIRSYDFTTSTVYRKQKGVTA